MLQFFGTPGIPTIDSSADTNSENDFVSKLKDLSCKYPKKVVTSYLNINSVRNKVENFTFLIGDLVDILVIAETKFDDSFPKGQFIVQGFKGPYRLDVSDKSGGILVFIKEHIISRRLHDLEISPDVQIIPNELNLRNKKWLLLPMYRPPKQDGAYFKEHVERVIDFYSSTSVANVVVLGDFNMEIGDQVLHSMKEDHNLHNFIKIPTCFKSDKGKCIDHILTNNKRGFLESKHLKQVLVTFIT